MVEIDTAEGPQFGLSQYKLYDFLEPGEVLLTFDDGPLRPYTRRVLDALDAHCTKATFFQVGKMAIADPEMTREIEHRGHTVGSHTWSHRNLRAMAPALAKGEVELGVSAVSAALGHPIAPFFRFPYLSDSRSMITHMKSRGLAMFSIDLDSKDFRTRDPKAVHTRVMADLKRAGKGIILFHDIQPSTAGALKGLLDDLKAKGYHVVHMVPRAPVKTLPEYDAIAAKELGRKQVASTSNPLAKRSVTWPVQSGMSGATRDPAADMAGMAPPAPPLRTAPQAAAPTAVAGSATAPARRPRPMWRTDDADNWLGRIFQN